METWEVRVSTGAKSPWRVTLRVYYNNDPTAGMWETSLPAETRAAAIAHAISELENIAAKPPEPL